MPEDRFNADEAALFWKAQPNCGLSSRKASGKKILKDGIMLLFICNAT